MFRSLFTLFALLASASAFAPVAFVPVAKQTALSAMPSLKQALPAVAAAVPATLLPSMAMATEGTNEWLGVDDLRLLAVLFVGHWAILSLYLNWSKDQNPEDEDFFGEIDYPKGTQGK
ncbi:hypothetical protein TrST_g6987 [Triparma strigata]|uniref:PSII 6.1 kDa protein n=1 Tax=Triparma strigata TaxID=1606541 RepID=A0A9W7B422_9STRA|nr:hypothetical protein TrST_g6987 [Triparma strigata]